MTQSAKLVDLVQSRIDRFLGVRAPILTSISDDADAITRLSREFLQSGKRFRALFCFWGWQAVTDRTLDDDPFGESIPLRLPAVVSACAALEVFHAAALVHDDLMDRSDTRRGAPSSHRRFEAEHRNRGWLGDSARFGANAALLFGDLLLCWSDELFAEALVELADPERAAAARDEFSRMRTVVTAGQYLDIVAEAAWATVGDADAVAEAMRVITYKSAKYSVEAPLEIGAALGGASVVQLAHLREFGLPLGIAFQLRDDLLGVFGDSEATGKPAGDDLVEGKRTVLIALARRSLPPSVRRTIDELLGDRTLDGQQIDLLRETIHASGAVDEVERMITQHVHRALDALDGAPLSRSARNELAALAESVADRDA